MQLSTTISLSLGLAATAMASPLSTKVEAPAGAAGLEILQTGSGCNYL